MNKFNFYPMKATGMLLIKPTVFGDHRGYFMETYSLQDFSEGGIGVPFVQDNQSSSRRGVLRGLHFQTRRPQGKLVRVLRGEVFDVGVDLRPGSGSFGLWDGAVLSEENKNQLYIPAGFAHGFLVLSETAEFAYKCTDYYDHGYEGGIRWDDPDIAISWPLERGMEVVLSEKDRVLPSFQEFIAGVNKNG